MAALRERLVTYLLVMAALLLFLLELFMRAFAWVLPPGFLILFVPPISLVAVVLVTPSTADRPDTLVPVAALKRVGLAVGALHGVTLAGFLMLAPVVGAGLLVVDTGYRWTRYAFDGGGVLPPSLVLAVPIIVASIAVVLLWFMLLPGAMRIATGKDSRSSLRVLLHSLRVSWPLGVTGFIWTVALLYGPLSVSRILEAMALPGWLDRFVLILVVAVCLSFVFWIWWRARMLSRRLTAPRPPLALPSSDSALRIGLVVILVTGLVVGAVAIRATETRPMHGETQQVDPGNPDKAYATALENLEQSPYRVVEVTEDLETVTEVDRENRRIFSERRHEGDPWGWRYQSVGTLAGETEYGSTFEELRERDPLFRWVISREVDDTVVVASPGYWFDRSSGPPLPDGEGTWQVVAKDDGVLELYSDDVDTILERDPSYIEEGWIKATIDLETGTPTSIEALENRTDEGETEEIHTQWTVTTDKAVERPERVGDPSLRELAVKVIAY